MYKNKIASSTVFIFQNFIRTDKRDHSNIMHYSFNLKERQKEYVRINNYFVIFVL